MCPLHHPNLVKLYGGVWNEGADKLCIVLELCHQGSLKSFLRKDAGTWEGLRHALAHGIARGLSYLHHDPKEPIMHRDIKPDNVLVGEGIVAKIADFGESRAFDQKRARDQGLENMDDGEIDALSMTQVGTRIWCSPEIMMGQRYNESVVSFGI